MKFLSYFKIKPWDGYLLALARRLGTSVIFSIDEKMKEEFLVVNPIPKEEMVAYHKFIEGLIK